MAKVKPIVIHNTETGDEWTLEFNRDSVKFAESKGFNVNDLADGRHQMEQIELLFSSAFRMHHKEIGKKKIDEILDELGGLSESMLERLGELYAAPYQHLIAGDDEPKNSKLTVEL